MNFLPTSFFHKLDEPLALVPSKGMFLDNPRTTEELEHVGMLMQRAASMARVDGSALPGLAVHASWPDGLDSVRRATLDSVVNDRLPEEAAVHLLDEVAAAAASVAVVCRFDDDGAYSELLKASKDLPPNSFLWLNDDHPLLTRAQEAFELGHLVALLACDVEAEGTLGDSFILDSSPDWSVSLGDSLHSALVSRCLISRAEPDGTGYKFADLPHYVARLSTAGRLLDDRLDGNETERRLFYAGRLLSIAAGTRDTQTRLVNLVALLELILTRNPDSSRFNVEDSLTKQFVIKVGSLLHRESPTIDLELASRSLKDLYSMRSAIAHGNFVELKRLSERSAFADPTSDDDGFAPEVIALDKACEFAYHCPVHGIRIIGGPIARQLSQALVTSPGPRFSRCRPTVGTQAK